MEPSRIDLDAEGLLDGLEGDARAEREELLRWLLGRGFELEQLRSAADSGLAPFLPAERVVMGGAPTLSHRQLAERAGLPLEVLQGLLRGQGIEPPDPDEACYSELEAELPEMLGALHKAGLSQEQLALTGRVLGRGLAQAAQVMRGVALEASLGGGASERELAERYEQFVEAVMPLIGPLVERSLRMHLRNMVRTEAVDAAERRLGRLPGARDVTVAFADLVGFTRLGEEIPAEELGDVADRLAVIAADVVVPPARMVKTIGDAAMLVSDEPIALLSSALAIVEAIDGEGPGFPQVRVGAARGEALGRGGDWFGRPVNLASRVTTVARAGSVLATQDVRDAVGDGALRWSHVGTRHLKGVPESVRLFRVRRADESA